MSAEPSRAAVAAEEFDRLDRAVSRLFPDLSRSLARKLIDAGSVFVDGRRCRTAGRPVPVGASVSVNSLAVPSPVGTIAVVYADSDLVAIDKPADVPSAPTRESSSDSAIERTRDALREASGSRPPLWLVQRLDAPTSGLLVFARSREAASRLSKLIQARAVRKTYLARVTGDPPGESGSITLRIGKRGGHSVIDANGLEASTDWRVLRRQGDETLLEVAPLTGRMHQIRVHLAAIGCPVVGDRLYRGRSAERLCLHSLRLRIPEWSAGEPLVLEAPPPPWS